jgi:hypothetical protein
MGDPGGGGFKADPPAIRALGAAIQKAVGADLSQALQLVPTLKQIEYTNFTSTTIPLAIAYVAAVEFVEEQLKTEVEHAGEIARRLNQVADNWEQAEQKSTIRSK